MRHCANNGMVNGIILTRSPQKHGRKGVDKQFENLNLKQFK